MKTLEFGWFNVAMVCAAVALTTGCAAYPDHRGAKLALGEAPVLGVAAYPAAGIGGSHPRWGDQSRSGQPYPAVPRAVRPGFAASPSRPRWAAAGPNDPGLAEALDRLNQIRQSAGLAPFAWSESLSRAAQAHAQYLALNPRQADGHGESPARAGFTGARPADRALRAGYPHDHVGENVSRGDDHLAGAVDGLMTAIYHRQGFLDPLFDEIGIGTQDSAHVFVMGRSDYRGLCEQGGGDIGDLTEGYYTECGGAVRLGAAESERLDAQRFVEAPRTVVWPPARSSGFTPVFYEESPDPLPDLDVSGNPVSVRFNPAQVAEVSLLDFRLHRIGPGGALRPVPGVRLLDEARDPNGIFDAYEYALFPLERLDWATDYVAEVDAMVDGRPERIRWAFRTRDPGVPVRGVAAGQGAVGYVPGEPFALYVPATREAPRPVASVASRYREDTQAEIEHIDASTLLVTTASGSCGTIALTLGEQRQLTLIPEGCAPERRYADAGRWR